MKLNKKIGYLTIDDSPSMNFEEVVNYLVKMKIPAIFFCEGRKLEKRIDNVIDAIRKGFIIGNHSYNHPRFCEISINEAKNQINKTDELIDNIYKKAKVTRPIKLFRFPFLNNGSSNEYQECDWNNKHVMEIQKLLEDLGYTQPKFKQINYDWFIEAGFSKCLNVNCTYDSFDWCLKEGEECFGYHDLQTVLNRMDEDIPEGGRGINYHGSNEIIMMHNWISINDFKAIINKFLTKGIEFEKFTNAKKINLHSE